jgi:hypothetical protein
MLKKKKEAVASDMSLQYTCLFLTIVNIICEIIIPLTLVKSRERKLAFSGLTWMQNSLDKNMYYGILSLRL